MLSVIWMVACALFGSAIGLLVGRKLTRPPRGRRPLPPASARRIERAARANRLELPADRPAVSQRLDDYRRMQLGTPPPASTNFDEEETEP